MNKATSIDLKTVNEAVDSDPVETSEWLQSLEAVSRYVGPSRAKFILEALDKRAKELGIVSDLPPFSPYRNTIPLEAQPPFGGDLQLEERITAIIRWNALAMVVRANQAYGELGGHIASYASAAEIFEVGFNHFFRADSGDGDGDLVFFQPHSAPGVYARAFLEGRLTRENLERYRQELAGHGLSSYPHPWLMPDFWQFPTGSMGVGPISAVYQARFLRYLDNRGLKSTARRHVWGVFGDGEMDEPESTAGLSLAAREKLDNLTFIINCNLQRLDGPVRGNGQIIQELESLFRGAGWNVIKVLWGSEWDVLFARDSEHALLRRFAATVDGKYQKLGASDGAYNLLHFFDEDPEVEALVSHMSEHDIDALKRGGHDFRKLFAAFGRQATKGRPTVILAKTKKGFGMGGAGESRMTAHQAKKLDLDGPPWFSRSLRAAAHQRAGGEAGVLSSGRGQRGNRLFARAPKGAGRLSPGAPARPRRRCQNPTSRPTPNLRCKADGKDFSTTVAAVRLFSNLLKDKTVGPRIVPIVADEARTFGMANLFRQVGIYSPVGQLYEPEDSGSMLYYREAIDGQLLEEGITEAGALSSWVAAATSYSVNGLRMLPFFIYYSMFGFQRVGDLIWAAGDQRARGFLIGATAGRTTLGGEGLQHQDGASLLIASTAPNCRAYDPAYAYEVAVIIDHGARAILEEERDEFYYLTTMNEAYAQPSMPEGVEDDIVKGLYRLPGNTVDSDGVRVRILGSGAILPMVVEAARLLLSEFAVACEVWSATSYGELARDAAAVERRNRLNPTSAPERSHVATRLKGKAPIIAASDYVRAYPQLIAPYVEAPFTALGTDGFGRSDTRSALRRFFEVDAANIVIAVLYALAKEGDVSVETVSAAIARFGLDSASPAPWTR